MDAMISPKNEKRGDAMRKVALVTGGSRGIGRACVEALARAGYSVVLVCRKSSDMARDLVENLRIQGLDAAWYPCDVASEDDVRHTMEEVRRLYHRVDVLVNNAGVAHIGLLTEMTGEEWRRLFAVNVDGAFYWCRAVLPGMIERKSGAIINIASMWGEVGASCEAAYSATKAALIGLTRALAKEVGPSGVRVNCVSPGVVDTDMNAELDEEALLTLADETPLGRIGTADEVARAVVFLAGENAGFITGQVLGVNGGLVV